MTRKLKFNLWKVPYKKFELKIHYFSNKFVPFFFFHQFVCADIVWCLTKCMQAFESVSVASQKYCHFNLDRLIFAEFQAQEMEVSRGEKNFNNCFISHLTISKKWRWGSRPLRPARKAHHSCHECSRVAQLTTHHPTRCYGQRLIDGAELTRIRVTPPIHINIRCSTNLCTSQRFLLG